MRSFSFILLLLSYTLTQLSAAEKGAAPEALVSELYKLSDEKSPFFQTEDQARVNRYFTKELAALIWKDYKDANGDIGVIDFSPLYDAQDTEIKKLVIPKAKIEGEKATVPVTFLNFGEKHGVVFKMVQEAGVWKIADIQYEAGHSLLSLFKEAAKAN